MTPTERFSNRVENYIRYRPGYPPEVLAELESECGLTAATIVADIGAGTGILTEQFLQGGNRVYAVEPNREMREAAGRLLAAYPGHISIDASAEATTLADASIDLVAAAQSLHWFDLDRARVEFQRILKPGGWVAIVWNDRRDESPFMQAYRDLLLRFSTDYQQVDHRRITPDVLATFYRGDFQTKRFDNRQIFDWEGIKGRLLSSSYMPLDNQAMLTDLRAIYDEHQAGGHVTFDYDTTLYYARL